jgi:amidase
VLQRAANVLLGCNAGNGEQAAPGTIHLLAEAFALADPAVREAMQTPIASLRQDFGNRVCETPLGEFCADAEFVDLATWVEIYRALQGAETLSSLGDWIADVKPEFGPASQAGFDFIKKRDRTRIGEAVGRRERYFQQFRRSLGPRDLICLPTSPTIAPLKGSHAHDRNSDYYRRTLSLTAIAGVGRLPQVSMPLAIVGTAPIGLSFIAAHGEDQFLLRMARSMEPAV